MSLRTTIRWGKYADVVADMEEKGISFDDIEKSLLKEGIEIRARGRVSSTNPKESEYRMALFSQGYSAIDTTDAAKKDMLDKIEKAIKNVLVEKKIVRVNVKNSEEFKNIYEIFTNRPVFYRNLKMAEQQLTNF